MSYKVLIAMAAFGLPLAACMQAREPTAYQLTPPQNNGPRDEADARATPTDKLPSGGDVSLPVVISEADMEKYDLDTAQLSYAFTYLEFQQSQAITFSNGTAQLNFYNLPNGRSGEAKLEILEAGVVRLRGTAPNVVLSQGSNRVSLQLIEVSSSGDVSDLTIDLVLGDGVGAGGDDASPTPSGNPSGDGGSTGGVAIVFSKDIKPILDANCARCHGDGGRLPNLSSASGAAAAIERVLARTEDGASPMPPAPAPKLGAAQLSKLRQWKESGLAP